MAWIPENEAELRMLLRRAYLRDRYKNAECKGKDSFKSSAVAREAAPRGKGPVSIYRCASCGCWHVGSHVGPRSRNEPKRIRTRNGAALEAGAE